MKYLITTVTLFLFISCSQKKEPDSKYVMELPISTPDSAGYVLKWVDTTENEVTLYNGLNGHWFDNPIHMKFKDYIELMKGFTNQLYTDTLLIIKRGGVEYLGFDTSRWLYFRKGSMYIRLPETIGTTSEIKGEENGFDGTVSNKLTTPTTPITQSGSISLTTSATAGTYSFKLPTIWDEIKRAGTTLK